MDPSNAIMGPSKDFERRRSEVLERAIAMLARLRAHRDAEENSAAHGERRCEASALKRQRHQAAALAEASRDTARRGTAAPPGTLPA